MGDNTGIEWADSTWNPTVGCDRVSPGCDHCYALTMAKRLKAMGQEDYQRDGDPRTSGPGFGLTTRPHMLDQPIRWRRPRRIFVNSMSDLFHDAVPDEFIAKVFAVMAATPRHTYQVLTKRHGRMRALMRSSAFEDQVATAGARLWTDALRRPLDEWRQRAESTAFWPLPNVWLGVSVEDQKWADTRVPALLGTPAAVRFLSAEPLLGPVDLTRWLHGGFGRAGDHGDLHWVIVGGESGTDARPMTPTWARQLRDECAAAGVAFLFKQWGEWSPGGSSQPNGTRRAIYSGDQPAYEVEPSTAIRAMWTYGGGIMTRRGKKSAGRLLDGRTYDEYPAVRHAAVT